MVQIALKTENIGISKGQQLTDKDCTAGSHSYHSETLAPQCKNHSYSQSHKGRYHAVSCIQHSRKSHGCEHRVGYVVQKGLHKDLVCVPIMMFFRLTAEVMPINTLIMLHLIMQYL